LPEAYYELLAFLHTNLGDSINILLTREYMYDTQGRFQTEEEAVTIDAQIKYALESNDIDYFECSPSIDEVLEAVHQG
jgi:hypothetical protein